jgi:hypothetical protein
MELKQAQQRFGMGVRHLELVVVDRTKKGP